MSAYEDALRLSSAERGSRVAAAAEMLAERKAGVVVDGTLALRADADTILREVIWSEGAEPEERVEAAKHLQRASTVGGVMNLERCQWIVVRDDGSGTVEVWRES